MRDQALIALMGYTFARVGAALGMKIEDHYLQKRRGWVRLREKVARSSSCSVITVSTSSWKRSIWLRQHTRRKDSFFEVANTRFYALLDLKNPSPVASLTTSDSTLSVWVSEVVQRLEESRTRYILWSPRSGIGTVNGMHEVMSDHLDVLRIYMLRTYTRVNVFINGDEIWERKASTTQDSGRSN